MLSKQVSQRGASGAFLSGAPPCGPITPTLFEVERTGRGRAVEVAMADAAYFTLAPHLSQWQQTGTTMRNGNRHAGLGMAPYNVYECADGHLAIICVANRHWRALLTAIDRDDLLDDERLRGQTGRAEHMAEVDAIVPDSAHGHSENILQSIRDIKARFNIDLLAGNVATEHGARDRIEAGADAVKVGIGPGSICTTRVVAGVGVPQLTAIMDAVEVGNKHDIPIIADGGIKYSGDLAKAIAAGASVAMIGSLFAGTDEAPGEVHLYQGRSYKSYRGMGSVGAMARGSADRYVQEEITDSLKLVPEGIEGQVPYKGPIGTVIHQLVGGLKAAMGYTGNATVQDMRSNCSFVKITGAGLKESHVHDVQITRESPNYRVG